MNKGYGKGMGRVKAKRREELRRREEGKKKWEKPDEGKWKIRYWGAEGKEMKE